ncbi:MAG: hypothetical protein E6H04_00450 [Bacillati bacterium ANGP1]|uniref:Uncharacterized protein n=1 Tax=Candidatus Segetimicrobium genomatis TaxID=2569760 RepID=A0A537JMU4_9BACT|nr:MAG: hypothetical protein E6H04_00450 [Terrabacteria group bacterium ANGP1]
MRVKIRSALATAKIRTALPLIVVPIAMLIPGSDVAFSQTGAGTVAQAPLFTAIELHPSGFVESEARGISGGQQVGDIWVPLGETHAALWRGSAGSIRYRKAFDAMAKGDRSLVKR